MQQSVQEIIELKEDLSKCMRRGTKSLVSDALTMGGFRAFADSRPEMDDIQQGAGAWTTAEGILAILNSVHWLHDPNDGPDFNLLTRATYHLIGIKRNFKEEGIPADPDLGISHRGVVDSTVKVILALIAIKRLLISKGWPKLTNWERDIEISIEAIETMIDDLCFWIKANQNTDGSWGLWKGEVGRAYPTSYSIKALLENGESQDSECIKRSAKWFKKYQLSNGSWPFSMDEKEADVASTSFAVMALTEVEPLWSKTIWKGVQFLEKSVSENTYGDVPRLLCVPLSGLAKSAEVSVIHPPKPRLVCALLQAGISPFSPTIQKLLKEMCCEELETGGWSPKGENEIQTWYTYAIVDSFCVWFTFAEQLGSFPFYFSEGRLTNILYTKFRTTLNQNLVLQSQIEEQKKEINQRKKTNTRLWIALIGSLIFFIAVIYFEVDFWKALLVLGGFIITIILSMIANYFYDFLKRNWWKRF